MVQNEYLEILLEIGLVGLLIFVALVVGVFVKTKRANYLWPIIAALLLQWWFFSGYPNSLHIFLFMAFFYAYAQTTAKKKS